MKNILLVSLFFFVSFLSEGKTQYVNRFLWQEMSSLPPAPGDTVQWGLASPFAGRIVETVVVAGGCNFPENKLLNGATKKYYSEIYVLSPETGDWQSGAILPEALAYGASVDLEEGILCIGGKNNEGISANCYLLRWDDKNEKPVADKWPDLPFGLFDHGAALIDHKVYVVAGSKGEKNGNTFLSLDLSRKGKPGFQWEELADFPGPARLQPVVIAQNEAEEKQLFLFSGSSYPADAPLPLVTADGLKYSPLTGEWSPVASIRPKAEDISLHGACGLALGMNHILFVGGVNRQIFSAAWHQERLGKEARIRKDSAAMRAFAMWRNDYFSQLPEQYRFNKNVLLYHTLTDSWTLGDTYPFPAPAGAKMVPWDDGWLVISGEIKPGVRSPKVYKGSLLATPRFGWINWSVLILYLMAMLFLGYFFMQREQGTDDFFKGGGRVPWWAAGMSIFATMLSAITFMAIPAKVYATDWRYFPNAVAILIMALPVIKYYLPFFRGLQVTTAYEYLEKRFNYTTRFLASFLFIFFMTARMALVLFLPSLALTTVTGIDIYTCILLMGVITIIYCTMGGVEAVIWGDVIQGFVLVGGALVAVVFLATGTEGGISGLMEIALEKSKFRMFDLAFSWKSATLWVIVLGGLANNLISYTSDQTVIQRYMTTKDEASAAKSIWMNGVLSVVVSVVFYFIGTGLYTYYRTHPGELNFTMQNADAVFPHFIMTQIPVGLAGLMIAAIFAATMSTVSSNINSIATAYTADFYSHFFPKTSDRQRLRMARISGVVFGLAGVMLALAMASLHILSLFDYFNKLLGLMASGLGALFLLGIFFPRVNAKSALGGFVVSIPLLLLVQLKTDISFWLYGFLGIVFCVLISLFLSLFFRERKGNLTF